MFFNDLDYGHYPCDGDESMADALDYGYSGKFSRENYIYESIEKNKNNT